MSPPKYSRLELERRWDATAVRDVRARLEDRGYTWTVTPISWENRKHGVAKLKIREMGSRYFFIICYVWLEKFFSRGDYRRR